MMNELSRDEFKQWLDLLHQKYSHGMYDDEDMDHAGHYMRYEPEHESTPRKISLQTPNRPTPKTPRALEENEVITKVTTYTF